MCFPCAKTVHLIQDYGQGHLSNVKVTHQRLIFPKTNGRYGGFEEISLDNNLVLIKTRKYMNDSAVAVLCMK